MTILFSVREQVDKQKKIHTVSGAIEKATVASCEVMLIYTAADLCTSHFPPGFVSSTFPTVSQQHVFRTDIAPTVRCSYLIYEQHTALLPFENDESGIS